MAYNRPSESSSGNVLLDAECIKEVEDEVDGGFRKQLIDLYTEYNPDKVKDVDRLLGRCLIILAWFEFVLSCMQTNFMGEKKSYCKQRARSTLVTIKSSLRSTTKNGIVKS